MEIPVKVIVPEDEIEKIVADLDTGKCEVIWRKRGQQTGIIVEFIYGPQGTWARIALDDEPEMTLCVGQSGKMQPVCFFYAEPPIVPEAPPHIISEEAIGTRIMP